LANRVAWQAWIDWIIRGIGAEDVLQALVEAGYAAIVSNTSPTPGEPALPLVTVGEAAGNRELRVLIVEDERFDDLAHFAGHKALRALCLDNTPVADVSPLAHLPGLQIFINGKMISAADLNQPA